MDDDRKAFQGKAEAITGHESEFFFMNRLSHITYEEVSAQQLRMDLRGFIHCKI